MTNSEKYKTAKERTVAFFDWCVGYRDHTECKDCCIVKSCDCCPTRGILYWLDREAKEKHQESFEDLLKEVREFADSFISNGEHRMLENPCDVLHELAYRFESAHNHVLKHVKEEMKNAE